MSAAEDKHLTCSWDVNGTPCGELFVWTVRDQEFYAKRKFTAPKYCPAHRIMRKQRQEEQARRDSSPFKPILDAMVKGETV